MVAFLTAAIAYAVLLIAIRKEVNGLAGNIGLVILMICILGLVGVGLFVTDPMDGLGGQPPETISTRGVVHIICGSAQLMLLPVAAVLINLSLALRNVRWAGVRRSLIFTGILPLLGIAGFIVHMSLYVIPMGEWAHGPDVPVGWPPRFLFLTYAVWLITLAINYIRIGAK